MKVAFVYPNSRLPLLLEGGPDSGLLGQNHLAEHGIDAFVHEPLLTRSSQSWLRWQLREAVLPLELRRTDAVVTPLARALPLAARAAGGPAVLAYNFGFNVLLRTTTPARRRIVKASLAATRRMICLGESQRTELIERAGLKEDHVVTVLLGTDTSFFAPRQAGPSDEPLVLSVGKDLGRDYGTFVTALAGLPVRGHISAMERNLERVDVPPNVAVGRFGPWEELRQAYARAACVVISQHDDAFPLGTEAGGLTALLEAMAMGRPIVATDRAVVREYVADGETALIVPPGDASAMRAAIERVLGDDELGRRLGAAARARAEDRFSTVAMGGRLAAVLRDAVPA